MAKYTDDEIRNMKKITCKIAGDYLGIPPMAVSMGMRNDLFRSNAFLNLILRPLFAPNLLTIHASYFDLFLGKSHQVFIDAFQDVVDLVSGELNVAPERPLICFRIDVRFFQKNQIDTAIVKLLVCCKAFFRIAAHATD